MSFLRKAFAVCLPSFLLALAGRAQTEGPPIAFEATRAKLISLSFGGTPIALSGEGGFRVFDTTARKEVALSAATMTVKGAAESDFESQDPGVRLRAQFLSRGDYVEVRGELENVRADERGFVLEYRIPTLSQDAVFSNGLEQSVKIAHSEPTEGNVFPVAAMSGQAGGVALAIAPSDPRIFGLVADVKGMSIRFYLGTSPQTRNFPNRAAFAFMIYRVAPILPNSSPGDGFRDALSRYYRYFPDYYTPRLKRDGLWMFQMGDRLPPNADQYGYDEIEPREGSAVLKAAIARDKQHGISIFPYTIVGEREIKFLPELPKSYDEAVAILAKWTIADNAGHPVTKESVDTQGDIHLKDEIESSACRSSDGKYAVVFRKTPWGGNSISFKIDPNPELGVGADTLALAKGWLKEHADYDGVYVDSLGANWPAVLDYSQEHFKYARYPLTTDAQGRVALHNDVSHYEFLDSLRSLVRSTGRLVFGNGIYAYKSRGEPAKTVEKQTFDQNLNEFMAANTPPEHYHPGVRLGRFFDAALLDVAGSEAGVEATVERCQDVRAFMGRKPYAFLNYRWTDAGKVAEWINKSLCYDIFATSTRNFMTGIRYEDNPDGYFRDKQLIDWFVPLARELSHAGWEPQRRASAEGNRVYCERYGSGRVVYYTLYNDSATKQSAVLKVDLSSLGMSKGSAVFKEIARHAVLTQDGTGTVRLELNPKETSVIKVMGGDPR